MSSIERQGVAVEVGEGELLGVGIGVTVAVGNGVGFGVAVKVGVGWQGIIQNGPQQSTFKRFALIKASTK